MRRLERASFVVGLALLCWLVYRIGPQRVYRNLADLGWGFALILALQLVPIFLSTLSWRLMLPRGQSPPLRAMARMLVAGEAVNAVSPVALVGGELVRISLLSRRVPEQVAVPSVALAATAQCCAQILFVLSGLPIAVALVHNAAIRQGLIALSAALAMLIGGLLFLALSTRGRGWIEWTVGRSSWVRALSSRVPSAWRDTIPRSLHTLRERPGRFGLAIAASVLVWQMGVVETLLVLRFLGLPVGPVRAYGIEAISVAIEGVLFFVPARMGTQEGGKILIFVAAGLDPAKGLALGLVRRVRELAWAALGLGVLGDFQRTRSSIPSSDGLPAQSARLM